MTSVRQNLLETREDDLRRAIDVGIVGVFHVLQVVARQMVERETKGSIIYISSPHARLPFKGAIDYNTAKAGGHMLALSAANELMWHGIRVNLIEPGWTDTPGERTWYPDEALYREGKKLPLGRLGSPEDIGHAAVYLASDEAAYVAGSVLTVDGGAFVQGPAWSRRREPRGGDVDSSKRRTRRGLAGEPGGVESGDRDGRSPLRVRFRPDRTPPPASSGRPGPPTSRCSRWGWSAASAPVVPPAGRPALGRGR